MLAVGDHMLAVDENVGDAGWRREWLGVAAEVGDVGGIGPELAAKVVTDAGANCGDLVIFGDARVLQLGAEQAGVEVPTTWDETRFVTGEEITEVAGAIAETFITERNLPDGSKGKVSVDDTVTANVTPAASGRTSTPTTWAHSSPPGRVVAAASGSAEPGGVDAGVVAPGAVVLLVPAPHAVTSTAMTPAPTRTPTTRLQTFGSRSTPPGGADVVDGRLTTVHPSAQARRRTACGRARRTPRPR